MIKKQNLKERDVKIISLTPGSVAPRGPASPGIPGTPGSPSKPGGPATPFTKNTSLFYRSDFMSDAFIYISDSLFLVHDCHVMSCLYGYRSRNRKSMTVCYFELLCYMSKVIFHILVFL